jgi:hypothetical protein
VKSKEFYHREPLVVWLRYDESNVTFYGQDLGGYPGTREYEYWITVAAEDLRRALGGTDDGQDIGDLVCDHVDGLLPEVPAFAGIVDEVVDHRHLHRGDGIVDAV